jgi:hypothetical protein
MQILSSLFICYTVPVYDGQSGNFDMTELHKLEKLPVWNHDLTGTISLVGYTANSWDKDMVKNLSLNIQWVVVLAA